MARPSLLRKFIEIYLGFREDQGATKAELLSAFPEFLSQITDFTEFNITGMWKNANVEKGIAKALTQMADSGELVRRYEWREISVMGRSQPIGEYRYFLPDYFTG